MARSCTQLLPEFRNKLLIFRRLFVLKPVIWRPACDGLRSLFNRLQDASLQPSPYLLGSTTSSILRCGPLSPITASQCTMPIVNS